jgi:hypothetical protein
MAIFNYSGAAYALSVMPEPPPMIEACVNFEATKSTMSRDSEKTISNLVQLLNSVPSEIDNINIYYYHHSKTSINPNINSLFLKLANQRLQKIFDALSFSSNASAVLDKVDLYLTLQKNKVNLSPQCEAVIFVRYFRNDAAKYLCNPPSHCKLVKCGADSCK